MVFVCMEGDGGGGDGGWGDMDGGWGRGGGCKGCRGFSGGDGWGRSHNNWGSGARLTEPSFQVILKLIFQPLSFFL